MHPQLTLRLLAPRPRPPKVRSYYDSTCLPVSALVAAITRAKGQDDQVLATFRAHAVLTPSACQRHLEAAGVRILLTSVRRSISTLTGAGVLVKTSIKRTGPFGAAEYEWTLVSPEALAA